MVGVSFWDEIEAELKAEAEKKEADRK